MALALPDHDERVFLQIVEAGSLKAAARQLRTDPSSVSRRLAALEARLGVQLMRRSTRGSKPTEAGARYYEGLARLVAEQNALEAAVAGERDEPRGRLRVTAPPEFGVRFVVPVLEAMGAEHADLQIELSLATGFTNLAEQGIDVAIRIGTLGDSALRARRLGRVPRVMVAAPAYLEEHGTPSSPRELPAHRWLAYLSPSGVNRIQLETAQGDATTVEVRPDFAVNSIATLVRLVESGAGLNFGPLWAFEQSLACGDVVRVLPDHRFTAYPLSAVHPPQVYLPAKTRRFIDAMVEHVGAQSSLEPV